MSQPQPSANQASVPTKSTLADWTAADDDDYEYTREKRQRGGRKKRKKNFETQVAQNWDDIYDPSRPTNYAEYRHSDEKIAEIREWKDRLYAHLRRRSPSRYSDSEDDDRPKKSTFLHSCLLRLVVIPRLKRYTRTICTSKQFCAAAES